MVLTEHLAYILGTTEGKAFSNLLDVISDRFEVVVLLACA